jgi:hypothetical protein
LLLGLIFQNFDLPKRERQRCYSNIKLCNFHANIPYCERFFVYVVPYRICKICKIFSLPYFRFVFVYVVSYILDGTLYGKFRQPKIFSLPYFHCIYAVRELYGIYFLYF